MYQVLARKWRPRSFDELVGQQYVVRALRNAIESRRPAHAYIFAGVRGIGKTTVARILAKCLNCETGPTATPCDRCAACQEIADGRSLDVLELDAASRTGVDDIRELQEVVSYAPARDRHRILILDEFHMLSKNASNALLKTLEEPPAGVFFILATTEIQKILPTILSRCQVFEFRRVSAREVAAHLRKVCDAEGVSIGDAALERIAWAGEGSVRDSLTVLERVLAFCGTSVGDEEALQVLGAVRHDVLEGMVRALAERDAAAMLAVLDGLVEEGHDLLHFWGEMIAALRDLLLLRIAPDQTGSLSRTAEQGEALVAAAEGLSREDLLRAFQIVSDLEPALKASSHPRFVFEAALIRLASLGAVRPIEELLGALSEGTGPGQPAAERPAAPRAARTPPPKRPAPRKAAPEAAVSTAAPPETPPPGFLGAFLASVHDSKPMLGAMLEQASISIERDAVVLGLKDSAGALRRQIERPDFVEILRRCARDAAGRNLDVRVASADLPPTPEPVATGPSDEDRDDPDRHAPPPAGSSRDALLGRATGEPGVRKLLAEFGAEVVDIRPLDAPADGVAEPSDGSASEESR